jgi:negative regulator of sigma E activity
MQEKFLKSRVPRQQYEALQKRAGEAGMRLGTLVRDILERDAQALSAAEVLARIEAALAAMPASSAPAPMPSRDHELHQRALELRLLMREVAMHLNAQILARVAAQVAAQTPSANSSRSN